MSYVVYLLECADGTFYTGITTDLARRLLEHNGSGKGARYTRGRRPVALRYAEPSRSRSAAQRREYDIRRMTRARKLELIGAER